MQIHYEMINHVSNVLTSGEVRETTKHAAAPLSGLFCHDVRGRHRLYDHRLRHLLIHGFCNKGQTPEITHKEEYINVMLSHNNGTNILHIFI